MGTESNRAKARKGNEMKTIKVEVEKRTQKAVLAKDAEGNRGWIPNGFFKDGEVSAARWEKAVERFSFAKSETAKRREWDEQFHAVKIARETERAIACEANVTVGHSTITARVLAWFPKSMVKDGGIAGWMLRDRARKIEDERPCANAWHMVEDIGGVVIA